MDPWCLCFQTNMPKTDFLLCMVRIASHAAAGHSNGVDNVSKQLEVCNLSLATLHPTAHYGSLFLSYYSVLYSKWIC